MTGGAREGKVFIAEDVDVRDAWLLTGRFSVQWEAVDGSDFVQGPRDVEIDEALRWGRDRARIVLVRVGDEFYEAGEGRSDHAFPAWPPPGFVPAPRPVGTPADVRFGEVVPWVLRSVISCGPGVGAARRVAEFLKDNVDVDEIRSVSVADGECSVEYVVLEKGSVGASLEGDQAVEDALRKHAAQAGNGDRAQLRRTSIVGPDYSAVE